jgi:argininosuccinate lyase
MQAALDPFMLATDSAEYLVRKRVPFRETRHISGLCGAVGEKEDTFGSDYVRAAEGSGCEF